MKIFCDTSFFVGFYDNSDQYHEEATAAFRKLKALAPILYTTDYIYDETLTSLLTHQSFYGYTRALTFDKDIFQKASVTVVRISEIYFLKARELYFRYNKDKKWSFTDCTSFAVMEDFGLKEILSFDNNFKEMGFRLIGRSL